MKTDSVDERSTFSHITTLLILLGVMKVRLLTITLTPFLSEFSAITANVLELFTSRLVIRGSFDANSSLLPSVIHTSVFEFPVLQVQVTVSPGHTDCWSQSTEVESTIAEQK